MCLLRVIYLAVVVMAAPQYSPPTPGPGPALYSGSQAGVPSAVSSTADASSPAFVPLAAGSPSVANVAPAAEVASATVAQVEILKDERTGPDASGAYSFSYEGADGVNRHEEGKPTGENGAVETQGEWTFSFPDGSSGSFSFVAGANGYQVESDLLPTPPPAPAFVQEQIERAKQEDAAAATAAARECNTSGASTHQAATVPLQPNAPGNVYTPPGK